MATGRRERRRFYPLVAGLLALASLALDGAAAATGPAANATIAPPAALVLRPWTPESANTQLVQGTVEWNGKPVSGVRVRVDGYPIPTSTNASGTFADRVDDTFLDRHVVTIADATHATVAGSVLTASARSQLMATTSAITVAYAIGDLEIGVNGAGDPTISGRIANTAGQPPPPVGLDTYSLSGTVTDPNGRPVVGAQVSTRTIDRDYWTVSSHTDARGHYTSRFTASDEVSDSPVPLTVRIAVGNDIYQFLPAEYVYFKRLRSATLNLQLPPAGYAMALPRPTSFPGAIYVGTVVGATLKGRVIRPLATSWTDGTGGFRITLPHLAAGKTVSLWEGTLDLFSVKPAVPGEEIDLRDWPTTLPANIPRNLKRLVLP